MHTPPEARGEAAGPLAAATIRPATNADTNAVRDLVFGILAEFGFSPDPAGTDADLDNLEASYIDRGGAFDLAVSGRGDLLGCVGLFPLDDRTVELRKMYLRPDARGQGLGHRLLSHALNRARELGFTAVVLQTATVLDKAIALYRQAGFEPYHPAERVARCDLALRLVL